METIKLFHYAKYLGLALIVLGVPTLLLDKSSGAPIPLLVGLFILLVSTGKIEDERSSQLKTTSVYIAFIIAYGIKLLTSNFYDHQFISFEMVDIDHFMILVLALANTIYYIRLFSSRS